MTETRVALIAIGVFMALAFLATTSTLAAIQDAAAWEKEYRE